jgi:hypothetical protein
MFLNVFKVRAVLAIAGLIVFGGYLAAGGSFGSKASIVIEFGMYPEEFIGREVEIDGEVVGSLAVIGNATRNAFEVKPGKHAVRVLHPDVACDPMFVDTGSGVHGVILVLDFTTTNRDGVEAPMITMNY